MTPLMRRRPLLRAAAVGGGAYTLGKHRAGAQEREDEQQPAAPQPAPAAGMSSSAVEQLKQLGQLHEQGVLTDDEFDQQKAKLLAG